MNPMPGSDEQKLDALFQAYREACAAPEASANFMPNLWARIDSRKTVTLSFRWMANALATAALALSLVLGVYMTTSRTSHTTPGGYQTYVEVLAEDNTPDVVSPAVPDIERPLN
jgi:F0F1-type ATP synthase membrane subunit a